MKKNNLVLVASGYEANYSGFYYGENYITVSRVFKIFFNPESHKFITWQMFSNGIYGTSRKWLPGAVCNINDLNEFHTDSAGLVLQLLEELGCEIPA